MSKHENNAIQQAKRDDYMSHRISHTDYYLWLSGFIGLTERDLLRMDENIASKILLSTDPHFNDIPLAWWDAQHSVARPRAYAKGLPWSLSDTVCCFKSLATRYKAEHKPEPKIPNTLDPPTYRSYADPAQQWQEWKQQANTLPISDLQRYAGVSTSNRHSCRECFCCACAELLKEKRQAAKEGWRDR